MAFIQGREPQPQPPPPAAAGPRQRVVVKLRGDRAIRPFGIDAAGAEAPPPADEWAAALQGQYPGLTSRPYFTNVSRPLAAPPGDTQTRDDSSLRSRYVAIDVPASHDADVVAATLRKLPSVETAYREAGPTPPPVSPDNNPRCAS